MLPDIAAGADGEIATRMLRILTQKGIQFQLSAKVLRIEGHTLHFADKDGKESSVEADYILNSTGRRPVVEDLGLEKAGVDFTAKGIKTSEQGKTNVPRSEEHTSELQS